MDTKTFSIPAGLSSYSIENPWLNQVPWDIYVAFIEADKFYGEIYSNPFMLDHVNLQRLQLYINGVTLRPIHTYFEEGFVTDAYSRLDSKHSISPYDFERGYTVFRIKNTLGDSSSDEYKPI